MTNISGGGPGTPPGWYHDNEGRMRWWDGSVWTDHVQQPGSGPLPQVPFGAVPTKQPWYRKKFWWAIAAIVAVIVAGAAAGSDGNESPAKEKPAAASKSAAAKSDAPVEEASEDESAAEESPSKEPDPKPEMTVSQENAIESAESYLEFSAFSKKGLIDQLSSEYGDGFPRKDAIFAVNHIKVDWNAEAVESAKNYLDMSGFSRQGLIDQLSSEYGDQFTMKQAIYAANKVGL